MSHFANQEDINFITRINEILSNKDIGENNKLKLLKNFILDGEHVFRKEKGLYKFIKNYKDGDIWIKLKEIKTRQPRVSKLIINNTVNLTYG